VVLLLALLLRFPALAAGGVEHVQDHVALFQADQYRTMEDRLGELSKNTGFEVFLEAQKIEDGDEFSELAERLFEDHVQALGHYRVALILIGVDRKSGRGMVGTNLGAGLFQVLTKEQAADLFLSQDEPFSAERILEGVDRLSSRLEEWHALKAVVNKDLFEETPRSWHQRFGVRFYPILGLVLLGIWLAWSSWRSRQCPLCGEKLRVRVRIGGPGGGAVRTAKCFECGHVEKRRFERWSWFDVFFRGRGTPDR
jgi:uncharacterized membrane protein YgcG